MLTQTQVGTHTQHPYQNVSSALWETPEVCHSKPPAVSQESQTHISRSPNLKRHNLQVTKAIRSLNMDLQYLNQGFWFFGDPLRPNFSNTSPKAPSPIGPCHPKWPLPQGCLLTSEERMADAKKRPGRTQNNEKIKE